MSKHSQYSASHMQSIEYLCIGWFDGMHKGHKKRIEQLKNQVPEFMERGVLLCFEPEGSEEEIKEAFLNSFSEKLHLLQKEGIEKVISMDVSVHANHIELAKSLSLLLKENPGIKNLIIPKTIDGPFETIMPTMLMQNMAGSHQFFILETHSHNIEDISTSDIKTLLKAGNVSKAAAMLGYHYSLEGMVVEGNQIGRTLGFPTANLKPSWERKIIPGIGVYAVRAYVGEHEYPAMLNIGIRPTLDLKAVTIEAHLLGFEGELYHKPMRLEFLRRIRDEKRFSGLEELKKQLFADRQVVVEIFKAANS